MTKSQINRLGERLRAAIDLDADLLRALQELLSEYLGPMMKAQALVREGLGIAATARVKTVNTIIEKLRRERTRLSRMQDLAGLRIVCGPWRDEQDAIATQLVELFGAETVIDDRRIRPSYGYRAVHVIAKIDGFAIEIQVRTLLQDLWAQTLERLSDVLGRGIRYGEEPAVGSDLVKHLSKIADLVAEIEELREGHREFIARSEKTLASNAYGQSKGPLTDEERAQLERMRDGIQKQEEVLTEHTKGLQEHLSGILKQFQEMGLE